MANVDRIEGNKILANFEGFPYRLSDQGISDNDIDTDVERWEVSIDCWLTAEEMEYSSSWDWIMAVVNKISVLDTIEFKGDGIVLFGILEEMSMFECSLDIDYVYECCVSFAKWYLESKSV